LQPLCAQHRTQDVDRPQQQLHDARRQRQPTGAQRIEQCLERVREGSDGVESEGTRATLD
jgi:hypothetical protein